MTNEELKLELLALEPALVFEEGGEWITINAELQEWPALAESLRYSEALSFDYLFCLTCVDWKTHLTMVYMMSSTRHRNSLVVKVKLDRNHPQIETVCRLWKTAELQEREVAEMFGVTFLDHPDPRKLILPDDWVGYPLRKDYDDPINMIKL